MKSLTLVAFLAVAFTAAVAAPSEHATIVKDHRVHHALGEIKAIDEEFLLNLISLILGTDVRVIIAQAEATFNGLDALLNASSAELLNILSTVGAGTVAEAQAILDAAVAEATRIITPILNVIKTIVGIISRRDSPLGIIEDIVRLLIEQLLALVEATIIDLEAVATETVTALRELALSAGITTAIAVNALLDRTVTEAVALITPLLDLIIPLLPPSSAHAVRKL